MALSKGKKEADGVEDTIKAAVLKPKTIGKSPAQCEASAELGRPVLRLRSRSTSELVHVYDVRNWTNLRGARYCILRFDRANLCTGINLVGVTASTKRNAISG